MPKHSYKGLTPDAFICRQHGETTTKLLLLCPVLFVHGPIGIAVLRKLC